MTDDHSEFNFNISLSVLDHLGRNLYRSFITVIGEAISNSWDADAKNVWIDINKDKNYFVIKDDGMGMSKSDFQDKFLKIGYTKRKGGVLKSLGGRPFIGRKGIGKLALLSCAKKISIITKTSETNYVGGVIDNNQLDKDIDNDITVQESKLSQVDDQIFSNYVEEHTKGTIIYFEDIHEGIKNRLPYIRTLIALYFRFSLIDEDFNIHINSDKITIKELQDLASKTQFLWNINDLKDPYFELLDNLKNQKPKILDLEVKGFIASVGKPSGLKVRTSEEKAGIDLFVNGRLREKDILKHMPDFATRYIASYLYGQIHFNILDNETEYDPFTTSREGIKEDGSDYKGLQDKLKELLEDISKEWNDWRKEIDIIKPDKKDNLLPHFDAFTKSKQEAINEFLNVDEGENLKEKAKNMIATISPSEKSNKKILITHSSDDSKQADIIYELLLFCGFLPEEILYTSSDDMDSKIPKDENILNYIRRFFVNDWFKKPYVFFIASLNMENSWYACLEVGAFWIIENAHKIATVGKYQPKLPLNPDNHIYLVFDNNNQCDKDYLFEIFEEISKDLGKNCPNKLNFLDKFSQILLG